MRCGFLGNAPRGKECRLLSQVHALPLTWPCGTSGTNRDQAPIIDLHSLLQRASTREGLLLGCTLAPTQKAGGCPALSSRFDYPDLQPRAGDVHPPQEEVPRRYLLSVCCQG